MRKRGWPCDTKYSYLIILHFVNLLQISDFKAYFKSVLPVFEISNSKIGQRRGKKVLHSKNPVTTLAKVKTISGAKWSLP